MNNIEYETFVNTLDNKVSSVIEDKITIELQSEEPLASMKPSTIAYYGERGRILTIKKDISITHNWVLASETDQKGYKKTLFTCNKCGIYASPFEYINSLSRIKKVTDNLPCYDGHNCYLRYTCAEIYNINVSSKEYRYCVYCNIPEPLKIPNCLFI